ncbi:hypothetical protein PtB15_12B230 [Puccinia triticina]|nr:hypothetical protein PtB15_12B230 [Puccinia triticina]
MLHRQETRQAAAAATNLTGREPQTNVLNCHMTSKAQARDATQDPKAKRETATMRRTTREAIKADGRTREDGTKWTPQSVDPWRLIPQPFYHTHLVAVRLVRTTTARYNQPGRPYAKQNNGSSHHQTHHVAVRLNAGSVKFHQPGHAYRPHQPRSVSPPSLMPNPSTRRTSNLTRSTRPVPLLFVSCAPHLLVTPQNSTQLVPPTVHITTSRREPPFPNPVCHLCQPASAKDCRLSLDGLQKEDSCLSICFVSGERLAVTAGLNREKTPPDIGLLPPLSFPAIDGFDFSLDLPYRAGPACPAANNLPALPSSPPLPSSLSNIIHPLLALLAPLTSTPAPWPRSSLLPPSLRPVPPPRAIQPTPALLPRVSLSPTLLNAVSVALSAAVHAAPPHPLLI